MWKKTLVSVSLLFILILTSCQKDKDDIMTVLKINFQEGDLPSLHPHEFAIHLRGISIGKCLFEGLTRIGEDGTVQLAGAKSITPSIDGLSYTIALRDNWWSNGTLVTASHYANAWKAALLPASPCTRADLLYPLKNGEESKKGLLSIDEVGVKVLDDKTLLVELAYPCPYFLELLSTTVFYPLLDPENRGVSAFNGPFALDMWEREECLRLKPNPYYWNKKNVSIRQIEVSMMRDMSAVFNSYEGGVLDWIGVPLCNLTAEQIDYFKKTDSLKSHPVDRVFWVFLNTDHPALSSRLIRQALSLAIDRNKITQHILTGGKPLSKPFPSTLLSSASSAKIDENLFRAKELFEQGLQDLGFTRQTLPPISISFAQQASRKQFAEYLHQAWVDAFGIDVRLDAQEWNVLRANLDQGRFHAAGCMEAAFYKDPLEVLERFVSRKPGNFSQWVNPEFSQKVLLAKQECDASSRTALMAEAEEILIDQMPFIPICSDRLLFSHHPGLKGYVFDYVGAIDFSYATLDK